ncbi:MAG: DUF4351 domain-containing protein [Magnetococcales bacterium]|nr:DUF4351 domain-containing protein [Magnetococcales bacterium]
MRTEVQVASIPPKADLILIQRKKNVGSGWTEEQKLRLADGLGDLVADQILAEVKIRESLNEKTLSWLSMYDALYLDTAKLDRHQLRSVIISAITPRKEFLERYFFKPVGPAGVYESVPYWGGPVRLIVLNDLANEPQNAPLKCFASRMDEQKKAFETIMRTELFKISEAFGQIVAGLWRLKMKGSMETPGMEEITPEYVIELGKKWIASMMEATPDQELFSLPRFEQRLVREHQDGRQKEGALILTRLLQYRFGTVPEWADDKISKAELPSLEHWSLRIFDAQSLEDVFSDKS